MKCYTGSRYTEGCKVTVIDCDDALNATTVYLNPRHDLKSHAEEFDWGNSEAGSAQLALALLADVMGDAFAVKHYQEFRFVFTAILTGDHWSCYEREVKELADKIMLRSAP